MSKMRYMCIFFLSAFLLGGLALIGYYGAASGFGRYEEVYFIHDDCAYRLCNNSKATLVAEGVNSLGITHNDKRYLYTPLTDGDSVIYSCGMNFKNKQEIVRIRSGFLLEHGDGTGESEYQIDKLLGVYGNKLYFSLRHYYLRECEDGQIADSDSVSLCCVPLSGGEYEVVMMCDVSDNNMLQFTEIYEGAVYSFAGEQRRCVVQKFDIETQIIATLAGDVKQPTLYWFSGNGLFFTGSPGENLYSVSIDSFGQAAAKENIKAAVQVTDDWIYWYSGDFDAQDGTLKLCRTSKNYVYGTTEELVDVIYREQHITSPNVISDSLIVYTDPQTGKLFCMNPEKNTQPVPLDLPKSGAGFLL